MFMGPSPRGIKLTIKKHATFNLKVRATLELFSQSLYIRPGPNDPARDEIEVNITGFRLSTFAHFITFMTRLWRTP